MFFASGCNLLKVHQNGYSDLNFIKSTYKKTLECNLFPEVLCDVIFANNAVL